MESNLDPRRFRHSRSNSLLAGPFAYRLKTLVPDSPKKMNYADARNGHGKENGNPNVPSYADAPVPISEKISKKFTTVNRTTTTRSGNDEEKSMIQSDSSVKTLARIRPSTGETDDCIVSKVSSNSLLVGDRVFTFDSVIDASSNQEEMFQLIGPSLVKHSLAGFHTSVISYGQTGSGKSYTMWGPPSAMVERFSVNSDQGIVPRVFSLLFSEIHKQQANAVERLTYYQSRCSFHEIYNEQITDLLDPIRRNLQIIDDPKTGFYVENLTEEYVNDIDDVIMILVKGLSNRKVGATSTNSKSSRSHVFLTCTVESWTKAQGSSSSCITSSRSSRISFIDLAGSDKSKVHDISSQSIKEIKYVNRSLSRLGHVVNVLAEVKNSERTRNIPYEVSCLTRLLRDTLGGNVKLNVICAVSPSKRYLRETISTLRFGQLVNDIRNRAVVNEISEMDVNDLGDRIRQLKEDLIRASSGGISSRSIRSYSARESVNQLRVSINRSLILPGIDNEPEEEVHADENDLKKLRHQLETLHDDSMGMQNRKLPTQTDKEMASGDEGNGLNPFPASTQGKLISGTADDQITSVKQNVPSSLLLRSSQMFIDSTESLAASLHRGLEIIDDQQKCSSKDRILNSVIICGPPDINASQSTSLCISCHCKNTGDTMQAQDCLKIEPNGISESSEKKSSDTSEKEELLEEIRRLRTSLLSAEAQLTRFASAEPDRAESEFEKERLKWIETESKWICLTEELRIDLETNRETAEKMRSELRQEKNCSEELNDALQRSIRGHAKIIEHYSELQEKYNDLLREHRKIMEGIGEVKKAAEKVGTRGRTRSSFLDSLAAELSDLRFQREREREHLKKENRNLKIQLKDTAEAVHAAGELLVRLRETEEAASAAAEEGAKSRQEIERMKKQMEKMKKKHALEMATMKHYLAESRLPEPALKPHLRKEPDPVLKRTSDSTEDHDWRSEFH